MPDFLNYALVPQKEEDDIQVKNTLSLSTQLTRLSKSSKRVVLLLGTMLLGSVFVNIVLIYKLFATPWALLEVLPTRYAGLRRDIPTEILSKSDFDSMNRTVQEAAWSHVNMKPWNGFLALDEEYTIAQDLPHSQR
ncbi:hypothetical protein F4808DRAFT_260676 [Astrocystis sublimbata]|nr:hypothetical protein F4808DRAFT_260676 [Astrocystis sublimbata]